MKHLHIKIGLFLLLLAYRIVPAAAQELYWENPRILQPQGVRFSQSAVGGGLLAVSWQDLVDRGGGRGDIYISIAVSTDGRQWTVRPHIVGPVPYMEPDPSLHPPIYSMTVDGRGKIVLAVAMEEKTTEIIVSEDGGGSFREAAKLQSRLPAVTPSVFVNARGGFILFVTESSRSSQAGGASTAEFLSLYTSSSVDGERWSDFTPFISEPELRYNFQPQHATFRGKDFAVFQSRSEANTFQLYLKSSSDGGVTWEKAVPITREDGFREAVSGKTYEPIDFTNQRPGIAVVGEHLGLVWERNPAGARAQIYYCELAESGQVVSPKEKVATSAEGIFGQIVPYRGGVYVLYSDNSLASSRIALARKSAIWDSQALSRGLPGISSNPHALVFKDRLLVFWETRGGSASSLVELRPVTGVDPPILVADGFTADKRMNRSSVTVRWKDPPDPAGIRAYRYTWSVNGSVRSSRTVTQSNPAVTLAADADGSWELAVTADDFAGNSSEPARIGFIRDTTPPLPVKIEIPESDPDGFLPSNTFSLAWTPPAEDAIARYTYGIKFIGAEAADPGTVPQRSTSVDSKVSFDDIDDGLWAFSVSAVDTAGNTGEPATLVVKLNKFVPYTAVYRVGEKTDEFGSVTLSIVGRGFDTGGKIESISLSAGGSRPYDYRFLRSRGDFSVIDDRLIVGPRLTSEMKSGSYVLELYHPVRRALTWKGGVVAFEAPGTIKIGDFRVRYLPGWVAERIPRYSVPAGGLLVSVVVVLVAALIVLSARKVVVLAQEGAMLREEVAALIEGRPSTGWEERKRKMRELERKGAGLRLKYTLLMIVLVILIVLIVSVPLSFQMIGQQRTTLADGLQQRSEILLGSLATSAENQLRRGTAGYDDIALVPNSISAMGTEALWATITGPGGTDQAFKDYVWASNDPAWSKDRPSYSPGTEKADDGISVEVASLASTIERDARQEIAGRVKENDTNFALYSELSQKPDRKSQEQALAALTAYTKGLREIDVALKTGGSFSWVRSSPEFRPDSLKPHYVFFKPIVYLNREKDRKGDYLRDSNGGYVYTYFQGIARLAVSTDLITRQITASRNTLIRTTGLIALAAVALGVLGAILLASITVTPIKKLAAGVAAIRDTEDKEELKDHAIEVRTRDEIGMLADTVNDMTKGLVKAAIASKELMVGKDVQKMFLPLEKDSENRKGSTGGEETPAVEIYGYYEGAKGVSGDYFDFKKLDDVHYAIIKCDVAGKGVPAALIMVEVATLFISYFRDWVKRKEELSRIKDPAARQRMGKELERVDTLVYTINDMIEERGFKGRFAALTVCLFNAETGIATVCNAGDRIMHLYSAEERRMVEKQLPDAPAAGVFPSMLVEMKAGFTQFVQKLDPGDVLFLFTDGFEESKRTFRDESFKVVACDEPGLKDGELHLDTHAKGTTNEEFGLKRIEGVINAVFNRGRFALVRHHNPIPGEEVVFDFSSCGGTVREAVLALVAVEKVFRLYRDPSADAGSKILVDPKVDAFLKDHFLQYHAYFGKRSNGHGEASVVFTHLREDDQYDDLTMLVLRKK